MTTAFFEALRAVQNMNSNLLFECNKGHVFPPSESYCCPFCTPHKAQLSHFGRCEKAPVVTTKTRKKQ